MEQSIINIKIKQHRKLLGLTQEELSKKLKSSLGLVKMYESGIRKPSKNMKEKLCNVYNISLNELEGLNDKEELKREISSKIANIKVEETEQHIIKEQCMMYFYTIVDNKEKDNIKLANISRVIINTTEQFAKNKYLNIDSKEQIKQDFINLDINEDSFVSAKQVNNILFNDDKYVDFVKNNIDFIRNVINELQFNAVTEKYLIPLVYQVSVKLENNINNAKDFIELPNSLKDKEYIALYITGEIANLKYELGNIAIIELNGEYQNKDDVLVINNGINQIRRFYKNKTGITLQPLNTSYDIESYTNTEMKANNIQIIGKIIGLKLSN